MFGLSVFHDTASIQGTNKVHDSSSVKLIYMNIISVFLYSVCL